MEASAEKRTEYLEEISKYAKEQIVHIDESGIDIVMLIGLGDKEHNDCKLSFLAAAGI
ncbi:hypothetical protein [Candidatus Tisiphia endosymbiont of Hybos culiciformis]|uniref:hypothetical protein n=1 Tax=Candidatus Tisiphia endosymbiont of Hybos culiciformis TaxID=3139331 RepID=UPI003CCB3BA1